jgi:hypothetical protein
MTILVMKDTTVVMFNKVTNAQSTMVAAVTRTHQKCFALWTFINLLQRAPIYNQVSIISFSPCVVNVLPVSLSFM